ncbi:MAG: signal peptidase I [Chloroflexi bacterium]|jgi:signal peptidase I|nr:MAG: putative signal peptidase I [Chloroflexi bacterium OLB13]MBC6957105.1 signal peptidase I [Chloroflexota bacterium]OQY82383.1 MAG: signal peptidase I [Anaerolineae bacterium UTCFX5]RIK19990.1 MAG: signal peptidase I [Chloroflexota bacterium]GIK30063.1 MAG: signal peptidase I [Chloroflexota bacterium]
MEAMTTTTPNNMADQILTPRTASAPRVQIPRPRLHRPGMLREILNNLFFIFSALIIAEMAFPRSTIDGPSMQPTLFAGQHLLISRMDYLLGEPKPGDIAVFDAPGEPVEMLIKRVIGVPGDTIEIKVHPAERDADGNTVAPGYADVFRNGELLDEPYFVNRPCTNCRDAVWELGPNEYFMMGDNRNHSNDSRRFGPVTRDRIVGRAIWRYLPPQDFGPLS